VAIAVEPGWKTIRVVLFVVAAHPRVGSIAGAGGDESTSRRRRSCSTKTRSAGLTLSADGTTRKRTHSALRVMPCRGEALEPAHEERGNGERATVGGVDGVGKKIEEALTGG
jgi:hypothetical protein